MAQGVDKPLKSKYKPKDFHKTVTENKTGQKNPLKVKKWKKRKTINRGKRERKKERKKGKEEQTINFCIKILPWLGFY